MKQLFDDLSKNAGCNYCLQPVVVKRAGDDWELIDGQQRLTTLYLLVRSLGGEPRWTLSYDTRPRIAKFLASPKKARACVNVDFHHIWQAQQILAERIGGLTPQERKDMLESLKSTVSVLWYEAPMQASAIDVFTRLNSGRIPLDDAELFKALVLSRTLAEEADEEVRRLRASEIAVQWDAIERDLRRPDLWAFVAGDRKVPTHISLLLEIVADCNPVKAEGSFRVFHELAKRVEAKGVAEVWCEVVTLFERIQGWHDDRIWYHRIGFLIAQAKSGKRYDVLREIAAKAEKCTKPDLEFWLVEKITKTLNLTVEKLTELRYDAHYEPVKRLLLLFNVETVAHSVNGEVRYPFAAHHAAKWELEHIHAQNAEGLNTKDKWKEWLKAHRKALEVMPASDQRKDLLEDIDSQTSQGESGSDTALGAAFDKLSLRVLTYLGAAGDGADEALHQLGNMALLSKSANSLLSNSAFDVKRSAIIRLDREGAFIPPCTKHVFLKYFEKADSAHPHIWGPLDRKAYVATIASTLADYFNKEAVA